MANKHQKSCLEKTPEASVQVLLTNQEIMINTKHSPKIRKQKLSRKFIKKRKQLTSNPHQTSFRCPCLTIQPPWSPLSPHDTCRQCQRRQRYIQLPDRDHSRLSWDAHPKSQRFSRAFSPQKATWGRLGKVVSTKPCFFCFSEKQNMKGR